MSAWTAENYGVLLSYLLSLLACFLACLPTHVLIPCFNCLQLGLLCFLPSFLPLLLSVLQCSSFSFLVLILFPIIFLLPFPSLLPFPVVHFRFLFFAFHSLFSVFHLFSFHFHLIAIYFQFDSVSGSIISSAGRFLSYVVLCVVTDDLICYSSSPTT